MPDKRKFKVTVQQQIIEKADVVVFAESEKEAKEIVNDKDDWGIFDWYEDGGIEDQHITNVSEGKSVKIISATLRNESTPGVTPAIINVERYGDNWWVTNGNWELELSEDMMTGRVVQTDSIIKFTDVTDIVFEN